MATKMLGSGSKFSTRVYAKPQKLQNDLKFQKALCQEKLKLKSVSDFSRAFHMMANHAVDDPSNETNRSIQKIG